MLVYEKISQVNTSKHNLRVEILAEINFGEIFPDIAVINFRELGFTKDFTGISFSERNLAGINFLRLL